MLESSTNREADFTSGNESKASDDSPLTQGSNSGSTPPSLSSATHENSLDERVATHSRASKADSNYDPDPIKALFNNSIWQQKTHNGESGTDTNPPNTDTFLNSVQQRVAAKRSHVIALLRKSLVPPHLLRDILQATGDWWNGWRPLGPWPREITAAGRHKTLQDFILHAYGSDNPPVVGLAVLCIAVSLSHLDKEKHFHLVQQLPRPSNELFQIYFERVDRLINTDGDFASTKEGIECALLSAKLFEGLGLPRKAWLMIGKAIIYGQQLGWHRPYSSPSETEAERYRRYQGWSVMCEADLFISMALGLPYTCDGRTIPESFYGDVGTVHWFSKQLMDVCKGLIDRNQMGLNSDVEITRKLQHDLNAAADRMPPSFWQALQYFQARTITMQEAVDSYTHQFFYNQIRAMLHMPLMLLSINKPFLSEHRLECLDACRGVLEGYKLFRGDCAVDITTLVDYSTFICASLLLLGVLGYGLSPTASQQVDQEADKQLVSKTLTTLKEVSARSSNQIASQALEGLQALTELVRCEPCPRLVEGHKDLHARITIPYFGEVSIYPGELLSEAACGRGESATAAVATFRLDQDPTRHDLAQPPDETMSNVMDNLQIESVPPSHDQLQNQIAAIAFDWNSLMNTHNEDWSWLADIDDSEMTKFL